MRAMGPLERQPGALHGIRILDLSRVLAGPWATQLLADYGAEVIKVERPVDGDETRGWGPPWLNDAAGEATKDAAYFLSANRNKRSLTVNFASADGQEIIRALAARSDVVVENFRVGRMARFGLDYTALKEVNEKIIYCSISAYGQSGSRADQPGYDAMVQASAGLMSITGEPEADGGRPQKTGVAIADIMTGMYAATAVLAALVSRGRDGVGQYIDLALYDSQVAWLANQNMNHLVGGLVPQRFGNAHPNIVPYQDFRTADGYLMLAIGNDGQFGRCMEALECAHIADDQRYASNAARVANRKQLIEILAEKFVQHTTAYWLEVLTRHNVPAGPINNIEEVFAAPYAKEKQLVRTLEHTVAGAIPTVANPVNFSKTPVRHDLAPPTLGEHTVEILQQELGYSAEKITALRTAGAI